MCALLLFARHLGSSALGVPNSELGHPASGPGPLEHGPGRRFTLQPGKERERQESGSFFFELFFYRPPEGQTSHGLKPRSGVGRGTLLRRAIRGNQLQSIDWVGSPWARRDPFR